MSTDYTSIASIASRVEEEAGITMMEEAAEGGCYTCEPSTDSRLEVYTDVQDPHASGPAYRWAQGGTEESGGIDGPDDIDMIAGWVCAEMIRAGIITRYRIYTRAPDGCGSYADTGDSAHVHAASAQEAADLHVREIGHIAECAGYLVIATDDAGDSAQATVGA